MADQFYLALVRRRWPAAIAALILVTVLAVTIREPVFEGSIVREMSQDLPELVDSRTIANARGNVESSIIILTAAPQATIRDVFAELEILEFSLAASIPGATTRSPRQFDAQLFLMGLELDDPFNGLLAQLRLSPRATWLVATASERFLVIVDTPADSQSAVYDVVDSYPSGEALLERRVLAASRLADDVAASLQQDLRVLIPTILTAMMLALVAAFRHWRALVLPAFASICSTVVVLGLLSAFAIKINLVTLLALPIVLVVSIANSCHFLARSAAALESVAEVEHAVVATMSRVGAPYLISSFTTAIALASLSLSEIGPISNLGLVSSGALVLTFMLVMLAAPLAIAFYASTSSQSIAASSAYRSMSGWLASNRPPVSLALVLIAVAGLSAVPGLSLHSDPRTQFPDGAEFTETFHLFESEFHNFAPLRVLLEGRAETGLADVFDQAGDLRSKLQSLDGVRGVQLDPAVGNDRALLITVMFDTEEQQWPVTGLLDDYRDNISADFALTYSSASTVYRSIDQRALDALFRSLGWSVLLILLTFAVVFRSPRKLLASLVANAVPLALICGAAWLADAPLNIVTAFVFLVVLGIVVDDTIHVLFWKRSGERIAGSSIEFSVVWSTVLLCLGLLLWQTSDFPTTRTFSAYCALALVGAVVSDLTLLPYLLKKRWLRGPASRRRGSQP